MKARFGTRLILIVIAIVLLIFGLVTLYVGIRLNGIALDRETVDLLKELQEAEKPSIGATGYWTVRRIVVIGMGALEVIGSLLLFSIPGRIRYKRKDFIIQQTDNGEIRIAVKAIENLVRKCTDTHEEINVSDMRVTNFRDGVGVNLKVSLPNNISIPLAVESLQKQIRQYLTVSSGITVKDVCVSVENTSESMTSRSPYEVRNEAQEKAEKKPVHERLFEDETEPAPLPAPQPAQEEAPAEAPAEEAQAPAEDAEPRPEEQPAQEESSTQFTGGEE